MIYGIFFYGYGTYLHFGYEIDAIDAHNKYILSSYQHYLHHPHHYKPYHDQHNHQLEPWEQCYYCCYRG